MEERADIRGFSEGEQCPSTGEPVVFGVDEDLRTFAQPEQDGEHDQATLAWCTEFSDVQLEGPNDDALWELYYKHKKEMGLGND